MERADEVSAGGDAFDRLSCEVFRPGFNAWLGVEPVEAGERHVSIRLPYRSEFGYHPTEPYYHGGIIASLIDIAGYAAVAIHFNRPTPTVNLHIDYLAPALGDSLVAEAEIRRLGKSLSRVDVNVMASGKLVALGRGVFMFKETSK